ncbi:MAG: ATP phosphoribosyltransferase regulatory subunit [Mariprofundaceae bacterium]|nr:ATP phosphoribosyltransferase regulatory subunit [Mariprofundaceae bacterium]
MNSSQRPVIGLDDVFGARARALRTLQSRLSVIYDEAGYEEVIPPLVERPQSLEAGAGRFLSDQTLVFSDPADTGLLAIRPDMTPQLARIAATRMQDQRELKLYYSGPVMLARPDSRTGSRQQWQTGVECLGIGGEKGDIEIMHLAALSMHAAGFRSPVLQVGHMGLLRAVVASGHTPLDVWAELLMRRSPEDMSAHLASESLDQAHGQALLAMAAGEADRGWLEVQSGKLDAAFDQAATELLHLTDTVATRLGGEVRVCVDAAVMPRFLYHSGIVFTGYARGAAQALLHGGRYDAMMQSHGRDMPATGFSFDLLTWLNGGREDS